jgi:hypothetical protein
MYSRKNRSDRNDRDDRQYYFRDDQRNSMNSNNSYDYNYRDVDFNDKNQHRPSWQSGGRNRSFSSDQDWRVRGNNRNEYAYDQEGITFERPRTSFESLGQNRTQDISFENARNNRFQGQNNSGPIERSGEFYQNSNKNHFGKGPKGYRRSDDRIKEDISEELYRHPWIDASDIEILVEGGTVTLTGTVEDRSTRRLIEDIVEDSSGVANVSNQLFVRSISNSPNLSAGSRQKKDSLGTSRRGKSIQ